MLKIFSAQSSTLNLEHLLVIQAIGIEELVNEFCCMLLLVFCMQVVGIDEKVLLTASSYKHLMDKIC